MGLFLALSGVIGVTEESVMLHLKEYAGQKNGKCCPDDGKTETQDVLVIGSNKDRVSVVYPGDFLDWDEASMYLSEKLSCPVFSFHIHDGDLWMFILFDKGKQLAQFNPIPEYWEEISDEEKKQWKGDADAIASCISNLKAVDIAHYLKQWDIDGDEGQKAYSDDEYTYGDCWQMCDFMKRIGLIFPEADAGSVIGRKYCFHVKKKWPSKASTNNEVKPIERNQKKPWWKFW